MPTIGRLCMQIGTGSRSEKIKTYNFKDSRMSGAFLWWWWCLYESVSLMQINPLNM